MNNVADEQAADSQEKEESLGVFKTSKALLELFDTASPNLSKDQLELMTRATGYAQLQAENMTEIIEGLGLLIADDEKDSWGFKDRCPQLLWQLSYQFDLLAGLIELGTSAEYRLNNPDKVCPPGKQADTTATDE
jgi:hypothetical protein